MVVYRDEYNATTGEVTRKVGIKVLDGSEDWTTSSWQTTGNYTYYTRIAGGLPINTSITNTIDCITTHCQAVTRENMMVYTNNNVAYYGGGSDSVSPYIAFRTSMQLSEWTTFLAQQYAQGTPVIVVYPLATATTETVTAQPLTIQEGTNIVEITQASMDNLELEVSYKAGVTVTITEIENAQLDNSVEVTING